MIVSELKVTLRELDIAFGENSVIHQEIERETKKKVTSKSVYQFGQIQSLMFPHQMCNLLIALNCSLEAKLICDWFCVDGVDISGMINLIPGAWGVDRIVKYICKNETLEFEWVDKEQFIEGNKKFYGLDCANVSWNLYSQPLANQFKDGTLQKVKSVLYDDLKIEDLYQ